MANRDERSSKKKKPPAKGGVPLALILVGVAAVVMFCLVGGVGVGGIVWYFKSKPDNVAKVEPPKDEPKKDADAKDPGKKDDEKNEPDPKITTLSPELQRVKDATVLVSAVMPDGQTIEGTGFLAGDNGLILTSATAAGCVDPQVQPKTVEVTLYPGQATEVKRTVTVLGVDRGADLAALRLSQPALPPPLTFEDSSKIAEAQTVHVADGKAIRATQIAAINKAPLGTLERIHVKDGIKSNSSGAAVVSTGGAVVGVALVQHVVASDVVKQFLGGKIGALTLGMPRGAGRGMVSPATVALIDPLQKIRQVRVEVWTGTPAPARPSSYQQPAPLPGDGVRQSQPLIRVGAAATGDVSAPNVVPRGQVVWVQPVITLADNSRQWGDAVVMPLPASQYDRQPANLIANVLQPDKRTVTLKATYTYTFKDASDKKPITFALEASILEAMAADPGGAAMSLGLGNYSAVNNRNGTRTATPNNIVNNTRLTQNVYKIDKNNRQLKRTYNLPPPDILRDTREPVLDEVLRLTGPLEAMMIPLPNRRVQPGDRWQSNTGVIARSKGEMDEIAIILTSTYEGLRTKDKKVEAIVTIVGKVQARNAKFKAYEGEVTGQYGFDQAQGIITSGQLKLASPAGADKDSYVLDIDLTRVPGNPQNIALPPDPKTNPVAKAKTILDQKGNVANTDPFDPTLSDLKKKRHAHYKFYNVMLTQGKKYEIKLNSGSFDAVLKIYGPNGIQVGFDDNSGGGTNAKFIYTAPANGVYRIYTIAHAGRVGGFHLTVTENP